MDTHTRIKARRQALHMTVEELAEKVGVSRASMFRYETVHIQRAPVGTIEALAAALNCSPAYLMGWTDDLNYEYIDAQSETHIEAAGELIEPPPKPVSGEMVTHIRIKERRTMLNIPLSALAKRLGIHRKTMYRYETPEVGSAPITVLEGLAIELHCAPAYLMGWTDDPHYKYPGPPKDVLPEKPKTPEQRLHGLFNDLLERAFCSDLENELYPAMESMMKSLLIITEQYEDVLDDYKDVPIVSEKISKGSIVKNAFRASADPCLQQIDNDSRQLVAVLGDKAVAALSANADETISE